MKKFFKDYQELCEHSNAFYKEHWKGVTLMNAAIVIPIMVYTFKDDIKYAIEEKFSKKES